MAELQLDVTTVVGENFPFTSIRTDMKSRVADAALSP